MPYQAMSICTYPGCNTLVVSGRCSRHPYPTSQKRRVNHAVYGRRWRSIRAQALSDAPICQYRVKCDGAPATEVDHIDNDQSNNEPGNLATACKRCHSWKTATHDTNRNGGKFSEQEGQQEG